MTSERIVRMVAGIFVLSSIALARYLDPRWIWFTVFVGANLLQSAFTNFCPLEIIIKKAGIGTDKCDK